MSREVLPARSSRSAAPRWLRGAGFGLGLVVVAWFVVTFLYLPNASVILAVIFPPQGTAIDVIQSLFASPRVVGAVRDTLIVTAISMVTVSIVGIVQVFLLEAIQVAGRGFLIAAYAVPLVFGSVSAVTGYSLVYGQNGILTQAMQVVVPSLPDSWFSGMAAVIVVHTFTMTGYHFLFLRPAIRRVDFSLVEAARSLGMGSFAALVRVVLPTLRPILLASVLMVFIGSIGSFAAPNILGGANFTMVAPLIQALTGLGRADMAALLGIVLGLATVGMLIWALREERRAQTFAGAKSSRPFERIRLKSPIARVAAHAVAYLLAAINLAPLAITVWLSFLSPAAIRRNDLGAGLTLENYARVLNTPSISHPLVNSLLLCAIAIPLALLISMFVAHLAHRHNNRFFDGIQVSLYLPYFLPGVLLALGFLIAFGAPVALVGSEVLVGSYLILPIAYMVILLPTMLRFIRSAYTGVDPALDEAARALGAGPNRRYWKITLPLLLPVLIQVMALGFNQTFDEYTVSVMLYNVNNQPLGPALGALASAQDPNLVGVTTSYVVINTVVSLIVILIADRAAARASARGIGQRRGVRR